MIAGTLRRRVEFQRRSGAQDTFGADLDTWTTVATVWGSVQDIRGMLRYAAEEYQAQVTTEIIIRWRSDLTPAMRAVADGRTFQIQSIQDQEGRHRELVLACLERVGQ